MLLSELCESLQHFAKGDYVTGIANDGQTPNERVKGHVSDMDDNLLYVNTGDDHVTVNRKNASHWVKPTKD